MPLTGSTLAPKKSHLGVMRLGASRLGYGAIDVRCSINGVVRTSNVRIRGLSIRDYLNGQPNTCTARVSGFVPTKGHEIKIGLGSLQPSRLVFAGHIQDVTSVEDAPGHAAYDLACESYEWLLNRRTFSAKFQSESVTDIVRTIVSDHASGFTSANVQAGLDSLDEITFTNVGMVEALDRLAKRIGAYWFVDYARDIHFFTESPARVHDITQSDVKTANDIVRSEDLRPVRTRVLVEGRGTVTLSDVAAGTTEIPIEDSSIADPTGGLMAVAQSRVSYDGIESGGGGAIIGTVATPTTAPNATEAAGTGLGSGVYYYAATFYDGTGETTAGPMDTITTGGTISAPSSAPSAAKVLGGNLNSGAYKWKVTFVDAVGGETLPSAESSTVTMDDVSAPSAAPFAVSSAGALSGGSQDSGATYWYKYTFRNGSFETLPSPESHVGTGATELTIVSQLAGLSSPPSGFSIQFYRTDGAFVEGAYKRMPGSVLGGWASFSSPYYYDGQSDGSLGAAIPSSNSAIYRRATVTIPVSPSPLVVSRKLYRTEAGGSTFKLVATIANNTATSYDDNIADGSLGATAPSSNTTTLNRVTLIDIPIGPVGTTGRRVYRTEVGGSQLKLLVQVADNTTTTYADSTADGSLGANVPLTNTSGLSGTTGFVLAGASSAPVTGVSAFRAGGGWALVGGQVIRYTGLSSATLTGIPVAGLPGALGSTVSYGTEIVALPMLTGVPASGEGSLRYTVIKGEPVNVLVVRDDAAAQAVMAALVGGDGVHEEYIQDGRLSIAEAILRGDARLEEVKDPLVTVRYETRDITTRSGREVTLDINDPFVVDETLKIQSVTITNFFADGEHHSSTRERRPLRHVEASSRRETLEALLRQIRTK